MGITVVLEDSLVAEAQSLTGSGTPEDVVRTALEDLVKRRRKRDLTDLAGRIEFYPDFDHKLLRT